MDAFVGITHCNELNQEPARLLISNLFGDCVMSSIACIGDLQKLAKRHVPKMFYDYADSGCWSETTYQANETDLAAIKFRQRVAFDVANAD